MQSTHLTYTGTGPAYALPLLVPDAAGKGWQRAEAALLGCVAPEGSSRVPLELRLARAALCEAVCTHDPNCGVDLVAALQVRDRSVSYLLLLVLLFSVSSLVLAAAAGAKLTMVNR